VPVIILLTTVVVILGVLLRRWFKSASSEDKRNLIKLTVWTLSFVGLVALILTGRFFHALGWALMLLIALLISGASAGRKRQQKSRSYHKNGGQIEQGSGGMSVKEACAILGLQEGASDEEIHQAYINLIQKNHPDRGGSDYLSSQINQAHDVLTDPKRKKNNKKNRQ